MLNLWGNPNTCSKFTTFQRCVHPQDVLFWFLQLIFYNIHYFFIRWDLVNILTRRSVLNTNPMCVSGICGVCTLLSWDKRTHGHWNMSMFLRGKTWRPFLRHHQRLKKGCRFTADTEKGRRGSDCQQNILLHWEQCEAMASGEDYTGLQPESSHLLWIVCYFSITDDQSQSNEKLCFALTNQWCMTYVAPTNLILTWELLWQTTAVCMRRPHSHRTFFFYKIPLYVWEKVCVCVSFILLAPDLFQSGETYSPEA